MIKQPPLGGCFGFGGAEYGVVRIGDIRQTRILKE